MGRIPDEVIADIRDRTDIVAVIGEHVALKKAGNSWKGLCPFHGEKTPSFNVSPQKRAYYCFGCQRKGDVFKFVSELQGKSFVEVVRELAGRCGVVIPERPTSPEELALKTERAKLCDVASIAAAYYRELLLDAESGQKGRAYLEGRGIGEAISATFQLGLAPEGWDGLALQLERRKVPVELALTLGLVAPRKSNNGFYDKFRDRLMCPVIMAGGEVVGFSGRTLGSDPETPKYVNSSESPIYKKSHLLFGLHAARPAFHKKGRALLVEGNFDVIALHQAGFGETVAPLGTALTGEQVDQLRRLAPQVIVCLDGDKAGRAAALKAIVLLAAADVPARVVALPDGEDPDSYVRKHGAEALEALIKTARPSIDFYLDQIWYRTEQSADARAAALKEAVPLVATVSDRDKRAIIIDQFAKALGVKDTIIIGAVERARAANLVPRPALPGQPGTGVPTRPANTAKPPGLELRVLAILADHPQLMDQAEQLEIRSLLTDGRLRDMYSAAHAGQSLLSAAPPEISDIVAKEVFAGSFAAVEDPRRTLIEAVNLLRRDRITHELAELEKQQKDAERRGDLALARELSLRRLNSRKQADQLGRRPEEDPR